MPRRAVPRTRTNSFPDFREALSLHMVETSDTLRALQVKALGATFAPTASYSASRGGGGGGGAKEKEGSAMQLPGGGEVAWHTAIEQVTRGGGIGWTGRTSVLTEYRSHPGLSHGVQTRSLIFRSCLSFRTPVPLLSPMGSIARMIKVDARYVVDVVCMYVVRGEGRG